MNARFSVLFLLFFSSVSALFAQLGTWNVLHVRHQPSNRLTFFGEAQVRSLRFYDDFHYYEVKGGGSWRLNTQASVTAGGGRYDTYLAGGNFRKPKAQQEIRTWLELGLKNAVGPLHFEHRYRAEQRFTTRGYRNRFRYRLACMVPMVKGHGSELFASVWNEVFLTNRAPYFERNRFFVGLVLRRGPLSWNAGWVRQFDYQLTDETGRSFLQIGWQASVARKRALAGMPNVEEN